MYKIQFDGMCVPNPGKMGIGVVLFESENIYDKISMKLPNEGTSNIAEYIALIVGLRKAKEIGWKTICIEGDSKLVISQVTGKWKIKDNNMKYLHSIVLKELLSFIKYELNWIPRENNLIADELSSLCFNSITNSSNHYYLIKDIEFNNNNNVDLICPKCGALLIFKWQTFLDGSKHIRKECPNHGFINYAPYKKPFISKCQENGGNN